MSEARIVLEPRSRASGVPRYTGAGLSDADRFPEATMSDDATDGRSWPPGYRERLDALGPPSGEHDVPAVDPANPERVEESSDLDRGSITDWLQRSPLADAMREGEIDLRRKTDSERDVLCWLDELPE